MKPQNNSILRIYGIFIAVSIICFGGIIAGFVFQSQVIFWLSLLFFATLGIVRILIIIHSLQLANKNQEQRNNNLSKEQAQLQALINSLGEAILAVNTSGEVTLFNAAALELIDSHTELIGKKINSVFPLIDSKNQPADVLDSVMTAGKISVRDDLRVVLPKADPIEVYTMVTPINQSGEIVGAIILARDVSQQKSLQAQKDEFLSVVSHELRTPVAIVEADLSTVLLPGYADLPEKAKKLLHSAAQNITYLSGLLQDISDLSHAERHMLDVELQTVDIQKLAKELADDFSTRAQKAKLEFKLDIDPNTPSIVSSTQRITEIIVNFLTNAIKYSSGVGKTVTLHVGPSNQLPGGVVVEVKDEGLGISEADQAKLFTKFFRSSSDAVQAIKGTGMGLYITTQQAKKIGGEIHLESQLGKGSTFYLVLPSKVPANLISRTMS